MAESLKGNVASFNGDATLASLRVVAAVASNQVGYWATQSSHIIGVTIDDNKQTGSAIAVQLDGIARVTCFASVAALSIVGPDTAGSGKIVARDNGATTTTAVSKSLGIALEAGSTDSVIRVALQINNRSTLG